jgi:hypothetical protein
MTDSLDSHTENLLIERQSKILKEVDLRLIMNIRTLKDKRYEAAVGLRKKIVGIYNQTMSEVEPFLEYAEINDLVNRVKQTYKKYDDKYRKEIPKTLPEIGYYLS